MSDLEGRCLFEAHGRESSCFFINGNDMKRSLVVQTLNANGAPARQDLAERCAGKFFPPTA